MRDDNIENIIEKYKDATSTLNEEQQLFDSDSMKAWSAFVKENKIDAPDQFNDMLWKTFQHRKNKRRKMLVRGISIAASVLLFASLIANHLEQKRLNYSEKEALLNQAIQMASNNSEKEPEQSIIYESDILIIYRTNE